MFIGSDGETSGGNDPTETTGSVEIASGPPPAVLHPGRTWLSASAGGGIFLFPPTLARLVCLLIGRVAADGSSERTDDGRVVRDFKLEPTTREV